MAMGFLSGDAWRNFIHSHRLFFYGDYLRKIWDKILSYEVITSAHQKENLHLLWQSSLVFIIIFGFMYMMKHAINADVALGAIGATSLGSSAFLAFVAHDTAMARARRMIFGYLWGILFGALGSGLFHLMMQQHIFSAIQVDLEVVFAAAVAMLTMLCMTFFSCEHPPAVGIAIGLVLRQWDLSILVVVFVTVLVIALLKSLLRPWLLNLL